MRTWKLSFFMIKLGLLEEGRKSERVWSVLVCANGRFKIKKLKTKLFFNFSFKLYQILDWDCKIYQQAGLVQAGPAHHMFIFHTLRAIHADTQTSYYLYNETMTQPTPQILLESPHGLANQQLSNLPSSTYCCTLYWNNKVHMEKIKRIKVKFPHYDCSVLFLEVGNFYFARFHFSLTMVIREKS